MRLEDVLWLTVDEVIELHAEGLERYTPGSIPGVRDAHSLASAVSAPQTGYYDSLAELAAVYAHGIAMAHPFHDGNKRAGVTAALTFLHMNGFPVAAIVREDHVVKLVTGELSRTGFASVLAEAIGGDEPVEG